MSVTSSGLLAILLLLAARPSASQPSLSTKSPPPTVYFEECKSNADCPIKTYCNSSHSESDPQCEYGSCSAAPIRCIPQQGVGAYCNLGADECATGLYCYIVCIKQISQNGACRTDVRDTCLGALRCSETSRKCVPWTTGYAGDSCKENRDCPQSEGFYCKYSGFNGGVCMKKKKAGSRCV